MKVDFKHDGATGTINFGVDIRDQSKAAKVSRAMPGSGDPDEAAAESLAEKLTGITTLDLQQLKALIPDEPLPAGFDHYRTFNAATGDSFNMGNRLSNEGRTLTLHDILFGTLCSPLLEVTSWTRTRKRPNVLPGFLDLDISIQTIDRMTMPSWKS